MERPIGGATEGRRAFSLAEVMLAMFILGVGIVAIASLFPAGIAQQRQSADDIVGPNVADNAIALLRTRVRAKDFGTFEELGGMPDPATIPGDWPWQRPGFFVAPHSYTPSGGTATTILPGAISVFKSDLAPCDTDCDVPWNSALYGTALGSAPPVIISQRERYYPMAIDGIVDVPRPEYVWDCMFRRFQGRILVAVFVYRVSLSAGAAAAWVVPPNENNPTVPPMPVDLNLTAPGPLPWRGNAWDAIGADPVLPSDDAVIPGTEPGTPYDAAAADQSWQAPGQWMLDENNNIHRVLAGRRSKQDGPVELVRPVPAITLPLVPFTGSLYLGSPYNYDPGVGSALLGIQNIVSRIWYIPAEIKTDTNNSGTIDQNDLPVSLTPVYICVREL